MASLASITLPLEMVSCEMPEAVSSSFWVFTVSAFTEFCKGRGLLPPVDVTKFAFALTLNSGSSFKTNSTRV